MAAQVLHDSVTAISAGLLVGDTAWRLCDHYAAAVVIILQHVPVQKHVCFSVENCTKVYGSLTIDKADMPLLGNFDSPRQVLVTENCACLF